MLFGQFTQRISLIEIESGVKDFDPIFMINTIWSLARLIDLLYSDYDANHSDKRNS